VLLPPEVVSSVSATGEPDDEVLLPAPEVVSSGGGARQPQEASGAPEEVPSSEAPPEAAHLASDTPAVGSLEPPPESDTPDTPDSDLENYKESHLESDTPAVGSLEPPPESDTPDSDLESYKESDTEMYEEVARVGAPPEEAGLESEDTPPPSESDSENNDDHSLHLTRVLEAGDALPELGQGCLIFRGDRHRDLGQEGIVVEHTANRVDVVYRGAHGYLENRMKQPSSLVLLEDGLHLEQDDIGFLWIRRRPDGGDGLV
jgi:hypothetical protein